MRGGGLGGGAALRLARPTVSVEISILIRVADPVWGASFLNEGSGTDFFPCIVGFGSGFPLKCQIHIQCQLKFFIICFHIPCKCYESSATNTNAVILSGRIRIQFFFWGQTTFIFVSTFLVSVTKPAAVEPRPWQSLDSRLNRNRSKKKRYTMSEGVSESDKFSVCALWNPQPRLQTKP